MAIAIEVVVGSRSEVVLLPFWQTEYGTWRSMQKRGVVIPAVLVRSFANALAIAAENLEQAGVLDRMDDSADANLRQHSAEVADG
jgi:hypothetical protein